MRKLALALAGLILAATVGYVLGHAHGLESHDLYDQRSFPCQEDEVLGYAPQFGPNRVGCIHVDELTGGR